MAVEGAVEKQSMVTGGADGGHDSGAAEGSVEGTVMERWRSGGGVVESEGLEDKPVDPGIAGH